MDNIEILKFQLKEKEQQLKNIKVNTFTFNQEINSLILEIKGIKEKIQLAEDNTNE